MGPGRAVVTGEWRVGREQGQGRVNLLSSLIYKVQYLWEKIKTLDGIKFQELRLATATLGQTLSFGRKL